MSGRRDSVILIALAMLGLAAFVWAAWAAQPERTRFTAVDAGGRTFEVTLWRDPARPAGDVLLLYMPGFGGRAADNGSLLGALTRRGYAVAALDDVAFSRPTRVEARADRDARTGGYDASSAEAHAATVDRLDRRVAIAAQQASAALDALAAAHGRDPSGPLRGIRGFDRVGALGFSLGGAIAAEAMTRDARFAAAANIDGWLFGQAKAGFSQPYMVFVSSESIPTPERLASRDGGVQAETALMRSDLRLQAALLQGGQAHVFFFPDTTHLDLAHPRAAPAACATPACRRNDAKLELLDLFFAHHLKGAPLGAAFTQAEPFAGVKRLEPTAPELMVQR